MSAKFACQSCALDEPAPAFAATVLASGRESAITGPVGQCPSPCLTLHFARRLRSIPGSRPGRRVPHSQAAAGPYPLPASRGARLSPAGALLHTCRVNSSHDAVRANDGQAAIKRPVKVGSTTATFAARLATLPATSSAPPRATRSTQPAGACEGKTPCPRSAPAALRTRSSST